jgi:DNA-binding transcriptional regulator YdaS (Cro superfamily)
MTEFHIQSVTPRLRAPEVLGPLLTLFSKAAAMGLAQEQAIPRLDAEAVDRLLDALQMAGLLGRQRPRLEDLAAADSVAPVAPDVVRALKQVIKVLDESPLPEHEWAAMRAVFGDGALAALLGISLSSLKRYAAGQRATPDRVAERLHWLAMVVADLAGSYNALGIRRWFERPRALLEGRSPRAALGAEWDAESSGARRVRELAHSLVAGGAT